MPKVARYLFLVDKGLAGFPLGKDQKMMGLRGTCHLELWFDNVALEPMALLRDEGRGLQQALGVLGRVRWRRLAHALSARRATC